MNREIKFRAWLKNQNKMFKVIQLNLTMENVSDCFFNYYKFDEIELMQYTGIKDKNGVEIYEGDIVKFYNDVYGTTETFKVVWSNDYCELILSLVKYGKRYLEKSRENFIEVIGNVYENPELLEVK